MKKNYLFLLFFLFIFNNSGFSQSQIIRNFENKISVGGVVSYRMPYFLNNYRTCCFYRPNIGHSAGIQLVYKKNLVVLATSLAFTRQNYGETEAENTDFVDISGIMSRSKFVLAGAARRYVGLFDEANRFRPDLRFQYLNGSYLHIFQPDKFSYRAAFRHAEQQFAPGGSWLAQGRINLFQATSDSTIFEGSLAPQTIQNFTSYGIATAVGYGMTWASGAWYASFVGLVGGEIQYLNHQILGNENRENGLAVVPYFDAKGALGYNGERFYVAFILETNTIQNFKVGDQTFQHAYFRSDVRFGFRLDAPPSVQRNRWLN